MIEFKIKINCVISIDCTNYNNLSKSKILSQKLRNCNYTGRVVLEPMDQTVRGDIDHCNNHLLFWNV